MHHIKVHHTAVIRRTHVNTMLSEIETNCGRNRTRYVAEWQLERSVYVLRGVVLVQNMYRLGSKCY